MAIKLLLNPDQCPSCGRFKTIRRDLHRCIDCQVKLHWPEDDFAALKRDEVRAFWVFFPANSSGPFRGWAHSSHFENPTPYMGGEKFEAPDKDYGKRAPVGSAGVPVR